ncbi:MAG: tetratricopeptide repeat protein [Deltaproteobacteria bacterium]|nr:tetratricopeptide repeat protein [Deltaproteobacteria bacterium]
MALSTPLIATKGYLDEGVENACKRALELSHEVGETPQLFTVLGGLNSIYFNRGEFEIAVELGRRMLHLAETQGNQVMLLWAHYSLGFSFASQGVLKLARDHLQRSIALYDPGKGGTYGFVQDPGPTAMLMLAHVIFKLGYPDQALERVRQGLALARDISHQFTLAWVLGFAGELYWTIGNKLAAQKLWEEMAALSRQQAFKPMIAKASVFLGFALVDQGRGDDGITKMYDGLYSLIDSLPKDERLHGAGFLSLALGKTGRVDEGLNKVDQALRLANEAKTFGNLHLLQLIKGHLFLMKSPAGLRKAKQCFSTALELARQQNARSDELRAAISLAKLLVQQGRGEQARSMLKKIYNWFTEGFDTADLKDAKALIDDLSD